jgi:SAM-dependent methyltransferase
MWGDWRANAQRRVVPAQAGTQCLSLVSLNDAGPPPPRGRRRPGAGPCLADFSTRDPAQPAFWDERFAAGFTPWDARGVPPAFGRWLGSSTGPAAGTRVLIPGCGAAYEVAALVARGCDVLAIDYSAAAIERARQVLGPAFADRLLQADFFAFDAAPFDWIYERAFLAALPPRLWTPWGQRCAQLLRQGGCMAGFFFVDEAAAEPRRGPPFAVTSTELRRLLDASFDLVADEAVAPAESAAVFAGRERWQQWRRR